MYPYFAPSVFTKLRISFFNELLIDEVQERVSPLLIESSISASIFPSLSSSFPLLHSLTPVFPPLGS